MCYLIAKRLDKPGCIALPAEGGKVLAALVKYLSLKTLDLGIQILAITDMDVFGEYKPYTVIEDEGEFIKAVLSM